MTALPRGFRAHVAALGIKDDSADFLVLAADAPGPAAAVFTRSRFAGPSVEISRAHAADGRLQAVVVISKNANVATGPQGRADADEVVAGVARALGCPVGDVAIASTGVIGRPYPMERIRPHLAELALPFTGTTAEPAAEAIMTTDTVAKVASATVEGSEARVVGVAKGVGMIEPDMATLITLFCTDAAVPTPAPRRGVPPGHGPHLQRRQHRHRHLDQRHRHRPGRRGGRSRRPRRVRGGARRGGALAHPTGGPRRRGGHRP